MEPVPKATSLEVKAHYGMQPTHTGTSSPLAGHSSGTADFDHAKDVLLCLPYLSHMP